MIIGVTAWAVALVGLAVWSYRNDPPTVPGQTSAAQARATMDRVTGELRSASPSQIGEYAESPSEITNARSGESLRRELTFTTPPGGEAQLLRSIAAGLPPSYHARTSGSDETISMYADAGTFVTVRGRRADDGEVVVTLASGCRATS